MTLTGLDGTDLKHQVSYEWDIRGQLAKVESPAGTFTYTYDPKNPALLTSLQGPAHKVEYKYEPHRNLITSVKNLNAQNQAVISSYAYENDLLGRRTQITQRGSAFDMLQLHGQNTVQVAYNDRSEVTGYDITKLVEGAKQSGGGLPAAGQPRPDALPKPAPQFAQTYAYDSIGNRTQFLTERGGKKTDVLYESNALNQYTRITDPDTTAKPTHDPDGNLLDDHRNHYTWNAENRMVKVEAKDGSYTVEKSYDYQGRKTIQKHSTPSSVKTTIYLYDGWNVLAEIEHEQEREASSLKPAAFSLKSANSVRTYTWGGDLSGTLQGAGGVGGQLAITKRAQNHEDSTMFPCYDANGNISQMISPKAEILAAYQYDAFGRTVDQAGEKAEENEWRFSTKPLDFATGFYYYGLRDCGPETGRWSSVDPIQEDGGVNLYGFVGNNGVDYFDVLGLDYDTPDDAAHAAGQSSIQNPTSDGATEWCGKICEKTINGVCKYIFTKHSGLTPTQLVQFNQRQRERGAPEGAGACDVDNSPKCPSGTTEHSHWHTHPQPKSFGPGDKDGANRREKPFYVTFKEIGLFKTNYITDRWDPSPEPYQRNGENDTSGKGCRCKKTE